MEKDSRRETLSQLSAEDLARPAQMKRFGERFQRCWLLTLLPLPYVYVPAQQHPSAYRLTSSRSQPQCK